MSRFRALAPPPHNTTTTHQQRAACVFSAFWLRAGEYYEGVDEPTPMHEATKENLLALIAESDDDEDAWAADLEEELFS